MQRNAKIAQNYNKRAKFANENVKIIKFTIFFNI